MVKVKMVKMDLELNFAHYNNIYKYILLYRLKNRHQRSDFDHFDHDHHDIVTSATQNKM